MEMEFIMKYGIRFKCKFSDERDIEVIGNLRFEMWKGEFLFFEGLRIAGFEVFFMLP
jgi:hypothetical protein